MVILFYFTDIADIEIMPNNVEVDCQSRRKLEFENLDVNLDGKNK